MPRYKNHLNASDRANNKTRSCRSRIENQGSPVPPYMTAAETTDMIETMERVELSLSRIQVLLRGSPMMPLNLDIHDYTLTSPMKLVYDEKYESESESKTTEECSNDSVMASAAQEHENDMTSTLKPVSSPVWFTPHPVPVSGKKKKPWKKEMKGGCPKEPRTVYTVGARPPGPKRRGGLLDPSDDEDLDEDGWGGFRWAPSTFVTEVSTNFSKTCTDVKMECDDTDVIEACENKLPEPKTKHKPKCSNIHLEYSPSDEKKEKKKKKRVAQGAPSRVHRNMDGYKMGFGKYINQTYRWVEKNAPEYCDVIKKRDYADVIGHMYLFKLHLHKENRVKKPIHPLLYIGTWLLDFGEHQDKTFYQLATVGVYRKWRIEVAMSKDPRADLFRNYLVGYKTEEEESSGF